MTAEASPRVRIDQTHGLVVVSFRVATIDIKNFVQLSDDLDEILRHPHPRTVEIDLTGIRKIDEVGMIFLQSVIESVKDVGGKATLRGSAGQIKQAISGARPASAVDDRRIPRRPPMGTLW